MNVCMQIPLASSWFDLSKATLVGSGKEDCTEGIMVLCII